MFDRITKWPSLSLTAGCALLAGTLTFVYSLLAAGAWATKGPEVLGVVALSSVVCGLGAMLALLVTGLMSSSTSAPVGILGGMAFGMGVPLATAAVIGFSGWLVACFEIALIAETLIAVCVVAGRNAQKVS